ncbi:hypothetical protein [Aquimarina sp. 2201CG14-23]|uniref:hypothetical protein n=1 Tax=Aquimarina mycalae TaxID=3040073 RepID=UPI002477FA30|nr:hypothetical protein [Aquimarina sp. 2201CG14-23]MDH7447627.1 hypothetical protein [Aquimarina sp. 2201CG14-23]
MKYIRYIILTILGCITTFFIWMYIQRANLDYNTEGTFLSIEDGVVYNEQAKEVYGILALCGLILTGVFFYKLIRK